MESVIQEVECAVDAKDLALHLKVAPSSVYRMAKSGVIPSVAVGPRRGGLRFYLSAVRAALECK